MACPGGALAPAGGEWAPGRGLIARREQAGDGEAEVKHRDRVLRALDREEPDRCPMQVSFTPEFASRLRAELGLTESDLHNPHGGGNTYALERAIDEDLLLTSVGWANSYYATESLSVDGETYTDEWGVGWRNVPYQTPFGEGRYTEMVTHPLADDGALDSYQPPDPRRPELYVEAEKLLEQYKDEYWIVGVTVTTIFETAWALRGYEQMLMDLALDPERVDRIFDIAFGYHLAAAKRLVEMGVDMVWTGDDVGTQNTMLISPATWRRFLKPRMATFISSLKEINPEVKVAYHSDGMVAPIIPDLIEIGLDVLNPIQPALRHPVRRRGGGLHPPPHPRPERGVDHWAHPPRPARHPPGELPSNDRHCDGDTLHVESILMPIPRTRVWNDPPKIESRSRRRYRAAHQVAAHVLDGAGVLRKVDVRMPLGQVSGGGDRDRHGFEHGPPPPRATESWREVWRELRPFLERLAQVETGS